MGYDNTVISGQTLSNMTQAERDAWIAQNGMQAYTDRFISENNLTRLTPRAMYAPPTPSPTPQQTSPPFTMMPNQISSAPTSPNLQSSRDVSAINAQPLAPKSIDLLPAHGPGVAQSRGTQQTSQKPPQVEAYMPSAADLTSTNANQMQVNAPGSASSQSPIDSAPAPDSWYQTDAGKQALMAAGLSLLASNSRTMRPRGEGKYQGISDAFQVGLKTYEGKKAIADKESQVASENSFRTKQGNRLDTENKFQTGPQTEAMNASAAESRSKAHQYDIDSAPGGPGTTEGKIKIAEAGRTPGMREYYLEAAKSLAEQRQMDTDFKYALAMGGPGVDAMGISDPKMLSPKGQQIMTELRNKRLGITATKTITRTGMKNGQKWAQFSDGTEGPY